MAQRVARGQRLSVPGEWRREGPLLARLAQTRRLFGETHAQLAAAAARGADVGPAGEWFLDNFHVVQEHVREVHETLPRDYYRELPELSGGPLAGYPRVYELAITLISHTEGRVDATNLDLFVTAFQSVVPLSLGELWAVPAMLRLALLENVRRMALRTVLRLDEIAMADEWAGRIEGATEQGAGALGETLDAFVQDPPPLTTAFVSRFLQQLRLTRASYAPLAQIEEWITERALGAAEAVARSTQHVALTQVMMANSITSLRTIAHLDWKAFVEGQSVTEAVLRADPAATYARMTFGTRDRYRHVVERIAKRTGEPEDAVARRVVALAQSEARGEAASSLRAHVGYYLVDEGLAQLEAVTRYRPTPLEALHRWVLRHPNLVFGGGVVAATAVALAAVLALAGPEARRPWLVVLGVAALPALDVAITVVNQLITWLLPPRVLPKLDLRQNGGIPSDLRTAVVIPTLFSSVESVHEALTNLEVQFLSNREAHLHWALLSDFTDAASETTDADAAIIAAAVDGVNALNARYAEATRDAFYLFHRPRQENAQQGVWMGWERKRGKLGQFNRFVQHAAAAPFSHIVGNVEPLRHVRYVITLDADTMLPADAAPDLIGALAHPLNRAVYDPERGRVTRGYGILQPRVGVSLPSAYRSRFAAIHSGHPGVDPYTTAVSDVYQDLFGEGSFTGKGIYDVETFEAATHGRFPDNTLLSHDLIEGNYARAGLVTEITVYDDYPARYLTHARRKHRWIRGDWQLLPWLTSRVPGPDGPEPNRLSLLSRWKIIDNLRRSTVEISQLLFFGVGWMLLPGSSLRWTVLGLGAIAAPWIVALSLAALRPPRDKSWRAYYSAVGRDALSSAQQVGLAITVLPHQAWVSADAIVRTLWRVFVSKRFLLEWQTARRAERAVVGGAGNVWRAMSAPAIAALVAAGAVAAALWSSPATSAHWPMALGVLPLAALWGVSPVIAHALSAPAVAGHHRLSAAHRDRATRLALLHWSYFDRFVTAETHWLAPDNVQEDPVRAVAMRTSPTNIGLHLLAIGSACDLGFITLGDMTRRMELVFGTLARLRRHRGHFLNWYDLHDLHVLEPAYVSTVDSGNLAGHLIAVRQACVAAKGVPGSASPLPALAVAVALAAERLQALSSSSAAAPPGARAAIATAVEAVGTARSMLRAPASALKPAERLAGVAATLQRASGALGGGAVAPEVAEPAEEWIGWSLRRIRDHLEEGAVPARERHARLDARLDALAERADAYVQEMDFGFLLDRERELFAIGYQLGPQAPDVSYYDLFASESRLASFVAIAKNDAPVDHWFRLGRTLTRLAGETALVSWSGSMFEYLMPSLVMRACPLTVLDQTQRGAVRRQIAYGAERGVPWGVSESAYNARDHLLTYQYRAFGVPDLALKRGLGQDLVVAPYATALAVMVEPQRAMANLAVLEGKGMLGRHGFFDAMDYTRPEAGRAFAVVATYMAHHIGMSIVALTNALTDQVWQERFHADPLVRSAELLLHERIPRRLVLQETPRTPAHEGLPAQGVRRLAVREFQWPDTPRPHIALLGRTPYTLMVSHCGSGYSRYDGLAVTRWRADGTRDAAGQFCYVKDVTRGRVWSVAHQPVCAAADWYRALLAVDRATFHRSDGGIETRTEVAVVPEDAAEVRSVTVTNHTGTVREIELTSYGEIVLGAVDAERAHPAFANLFVETEYHEWCTAITATRRPRSATETPLWCVHVVNAGPERVGEVTCETDRARFVGRGASTRSPRALTHDGPLSGTTGAVLDPIVALRTRLRLEPGQSASVAFTTLVATSRERAFALADRYHDPYTAQRALGLAWTSAHVELQELALTPSDAAVFQELAGCLLYPLAGLRAPESELRRNRGAQPLLWANGISGDWPIVLATIESVDGLPTLRQLLAAHQYWTRRGMTVDLVIVIAQPSSYLQALHDRILEAMFAANDAQMDRPGGVFVRRRDVIDADALLMLQGTALLDIRCDGRPLSLLLEAGASLDQEAPASATSVDVPWRVVEDPRPTMPARAEGDRALLFDNGLGGLAATGDYEIRVRGTAVPPAPWVNVVANPHGGFVVSERGTGCTWAENSYFYRLTPWHNDPVSDPATEVLYLRDEDSGEVWSATPAPAGGDVAFLVRHGAGSSVFSGEWQGIASRLEMAMAEGEAVKLSLLRLTNRGPERRRISVTAYVEWTLGTLREQTRHQVRTSFDVQQGAVFAQNFFDPQFSDWVAFCALSEPVSAHTGDRCEFLGRNGSLVAPAALRRRGLGARTGVGIDPCAALQCQIALEPGETREVTVVLGAAEGSGAARETIARYRGPRLAALAIAGSLDQWKARLSVVTVRTPDPAFDAMLNRWALYQALGCRMWARSALYQSSGAYGFRDQLQDVLAFVYAEPAVARAHLLRAAARQFEEGDVQHWWHTPSGRGVRTRFSDDMVWLPYVVDQYVRVTGDRSVLDEYVPFLSMRALESHEHEVYDLPQVIDEHASVYEHCLRALRKACTTGAHGLPLIGTGDWNDGMNRVGAEGRGESVWLGWFLAATLRGFAGHCDARGDLGTAADCRARADGYVAAIEAHGWDGAWYRRAYFDDGTPLGSSANAECRIDAIAQSWSVISGAGAPARQRQAMQSLDEHLVRPAERLLLLLTPPFDQSPVDPGYIKGYVPGVRENGAQYTHAALWTVLATAMQGDGDRAFELFQMLNPLNHTRTAAEVETYKTEPYVVAADVYAAAGQVGRGGWTWYTGSASWMYRVGLEAILGFTKRGDTLTIDPRVPSAWPEFSIEYRFGTAQYAITVRHPGEWPRRGVLVRVDGRLQDGATITLVDDGARHEVVVECGGQG